MGQPQLWDKAFCNKVGLILRNFGFRLPKRGRTPGFQRDWAKVLRDKASSYRNKMDSGLYKNIFVIGPDNMTDALKRLVSILQGLARHDRRKPRVAPRPGGHR